MEGGIAMRRPAAILLAMLLLASVAPPVDMPGASATEPAAKPKKPLARPKAAAVPAKQLFGAAATPAPLAARAIGFYARGCLAGAKPLAIDGPAWQAMRLSRNRNWGHPQLVKLVEQLANDAKAKDGWRGLLVGDMSQPRGGPMLTGHASHQVGLDADIWLTQMPDRRLSEKEREELSATSMLAADGLGIDPAVWTSAHGKLIRRAAAFPEVERVLVHPAIKKALCESKEGDRSVLHKIRPYWGHHYHMHVRMACPKGSTNCEAQPAPPADDGCGKELDDWFTLLKRPPRPDAKPAKPKPPLTMAQLPAECKVVLEAKVSEVVEAKPVAPEARTKELPEARTKELPEARTKEVPEARTQDAPEARTQEAPASASDPKRALGASRTDSKQ
jgi:penicillin-insensitive murein DD-endopeptidase